MAKTEPWHVPESAGFTTGASEVGGLNVVGGGEAVYHDRDDCPVARAIPLDQRVNGTGGYRLCDACRALPG